MHVLPKRVIVMVCDGRTLKCYSRSFTQVKYTVILYFHDNQYKIYSHTESVDKAQAEFQLWEPQFTPGLKPLHIMRSDRYKLLGFCNFGRN